MRGPIKYYLLGAIVLSLGILGYFVINRWEASRTFVTSIFKTETVVQPSPSPEPLPSLSFPTEIDKGRILESVLLQFRQLDESDESFSRW